MIKKKDVGLVVDTNILIDIIKAADPSAPLVDQLVGWVKKIVSETDPRPRGKTVTLFASTKVLDDYSTVLSRLMGKHGKQIRYIFDKKTSSKQPVDAGCRIYMSFRRYNSQASPAPRRRLTHKSDEKFLVLFEDVLKSKKWKDWAIILASRDTATFSEITDITRSDERTCLVDSKDGLDKAIEC